ncbi:hypothetical protein LTR56_006367 [Elasticomyces elasticus]|nr:hypothetical protein LTR56_006367 [Elasticomyces elasticus]KAK3663412.1 hypothetical protein LTR22_005822 [Elasticomyces elasticus]KAK4925491.1 hypothetical protein LTR49_007558 [Elasticomyces elasticus]KAK5764586.1 hypothetical protein LTS12_005319 [Elasticomyces elasticus]
MAFAKACVLAFGHALDSHQNPKVQSTLAASILAWALFALFSSAFQCGLPEPWVYTPWRCHHGGLVYAVLALNILTDACLAVLLVPTVWRLQMKRTLRISVCVFFASRILVCAAGASKFAWLPAALSTGDTTCWQAPVIIASQIMINLSIITANLPALKRFLNDLKTGQTSTRLPDGQYELSKNTWVGSGDPSGLHKIGSDHDHVVDIQSRQQEEETHSETGSETGILRVVDIAITSEKSEHM